MNGNLLESVDSEKDFGVIMDSELKFHIHTSSAIKKANKILGLIKRTFVYKSMVRPILEYGNTIWGPHFKLGQQAIEKIQRRATKFVGAISNLTYKERLERSNLPSLFYRRRRGHKQKFFKERAKKTVRSQSFSRRVINEWNGLSLEIVDAETG